MPLNINAKYLANPINTGQETVLVNALSLSDYRAFRRLVPDAPAVSLGENTAVLFDDDYDIAYNLRTYQKILRWKMVKTPLRQHVSRLFW